MSILRPNRTLLLWNVTRAGTGVELSAARDWPVTEPVNAGNGVKVLVPLAGTAKFWISAISVGLRPISASGGI